MNPIPDFTPMVSPVSNQLIVGATASMSTPEIASMEEGPALSPKEKVGVGLDVVSIFREVGELITEVKEAAHSEFSKVLKASKMINVLAIPIALSSVSSQVGTLVKGGPKEEISLAAVGLASSIGSSASSVSSTATGIYVAAEVSKGAWVSILGSVATALSIFGIVFSGLSYDYTDKVTDKIDSVLRDKGPKRLENIEAYLKELKEKEEKYLSRHFNLRSGGADKVKMLIEKALAGSAQEKVDLLANLEGRAIKKKNADARDLVLSAFTFMILFPLSFSPIGWAAIALGIASSLLYLANLAYRVRASGEPLVQMKNRAENERYLTAK